MEFLLQQEQQEDVKSVWDKLVPIVKYGREYDIYLTSEIIYPFEYNEMCHVLSKLSNRNSVRLHITTPGGQLGSALKMCTAIQESPAEVTAVLSGSVASAGTIIALSCDKIECDFSLEFMIHMLSGGTEGKANEMKAQAQFMQRHYPELFKKIYKDFLTEDEIDLVIEGKDIWLDGDEVLERWNRMVV